MNSGAITIAVAHPVFIAPEWSWHAIINIGLPLALVTLTGQYVPGMAVLRTLGLQHPGALVISVTAIGSVLMAPFGSHGFNLAAITAAICTGREAHEDRDKRYIAGIACGVFYILMGTFGATLASVFSALPKELIASLAGLALFGAISAGLTGAMADEKQREAALITFLVTASGMSFLGLGRGVLGAGTRDTRQCCAEQPAGQQTAGKFTAQTSEIACCASTGDTFSRPALKRRRWQCQPVTWL